MLMTVRVFLSPSSDADFAPAPEGQMREIVGFNLFPGWFTRLMDRFGHFGLTLFTGSINDFFLAHRNLSFATATLAGLPTVSVSKQRSYADGRLAA